MLGVKHVCWSRKCEMSCVLAVLGAVLSICIRIGTVAVEENDASVGEQCM
jgi:hypothetical protein